MNRLHNEPSLYLRQHAHNPVDWYPWGDEAFEKAKAGKKPVIVSIGYAACHWCHVMERESFEDAGVAAYMNAHFVCIKVDREERPDVDSVYMDAVQALTGAGGWPLNVFVTPERLPFYGGTYFPPQPAYGRVSWMQLLERMAQIWEERQEEVTQQSAQMQAYLQQAARVATSGGAQDSGAADVRAMAASLLQMADKEHGGFGRAPKFPGTMAITFLLEHYHYTRDEAALDQALLSLDKMAQGGIYDQLAGGFARYSTDEVWLAPHFEKMLYDNALLILAYCDAFQLTQNEDYRRVIEETIAFVNRELKDDFGGFYSALDADSEGVEGKFYTFTWPEWIRACGGEFLLAARHFGATPHGNWEHTNIMHLAVSMEQISQDTGASLQDIAEEVAHVRKALLEARSERIRPATDDKCLLSWNALMNLALSRAGRVLQRKDYLNEAIAHARWMTHNFSKGGALFHVWRGGEARVAAHLDDYACLIRALTELAAAAGDNRWIVEAMEWTEQTLLRFGDKETGFFFFTDGNESALPVRKTEVYDGATPSANAVMAHNLAVLGLIAGRQEWMARSGKMLLAMSGNATRYTYSFGYWAALLQRRAAGWKMAVSSGPEGEKMHESAGSITAPHAIFLLRAKENEPVSAISDKFVAGKTCMFVCTATACLPPVHTASAAEPLISAPL